MFIISVQKIKLERKKTEFEWRFEINAICMGKHLHVLNVEKYQKCLVVVKICFQWRLHRVKL